MSADSALWGVLVTLAAYQVGRYAQHKLPPGVWRSLAQPVLVAVVLVGALLVLADLDYDDYRQGGDLISFVLGPAVVALAVPLHREAARIARAALPILGAVVAGVIVSIASVVLVAGWLGASESVLRSVAPKSTTTPVALALAGQEGGVPALAAVCAVTAGILGAVLGPALLDLLRVRDPRARGLAVGAVSHGIGTARVLPESATEGAFSGLCMGLTALGTSLLLPVLLPVALRWAGA